MPLTTAPVRLVLPEWEVGRYVDVCTSFGGLENQQAAIAAQSLYASPLIVPTPTRIDRLGVHVTVAAAAGKIGRPMIHLPNSRRLPGALFLDGGTVLVDVTGERSNVVDAVLPAGLIYFTFLSDGAPSIQTANVIYALVPYGFTTMTAAAAGGGSPQRTVVGTAAPDPWGTPTAFTNNTWVRIGARIAAL